MPRRWHLEALLPASLLLNSFYLLFWWSLSLGGDGLNVLFRAKHSSMTYSQYCVQPQFTAFTITHWKEASSQVKGERAICLWTTYIFRRYVSWTIVFSVPPGPWSLRTVIPPCHELHTEQNTLGIFASIISEGLNTIDKLCKIHRKDLKTNYLCISLFKSLL